jgi:hypothetical protein
VDLFEDEKDLNHDTFDAILFDTSETIYSKDEDDENDDLGELNLGETEQLKIISKIGAWVASQAK